MKPNSKDKNQKIDNVEHDSIVIYQTAEGKADFEVKIQKETVWLTQQQIADLFGTQRPAITKHLGNIFKSKELDENAVRSILEHTAPDGKKYKTKFFNLDAIISVGYRVNSKRATQFRIWATRTLKDYLVQGYAINEKRLEEQQQKFKELQQAINFLKEKSSSKELKGQVEEILSIIHQYANTFTLLRDYDENRINVYKTKGPSFILSYDESKALIGKFAIELTQKDEAGTLFGQEVEDKFKGIMGAIYQTFGGEDLYSTIEEKAANLLYLIIKDHPFADGNKRIGSLLFVYFLDKNSYLFKATGETKINDNTLVALALLIAISNPQEKDIMIKMITNLLKG